MVIGGSVWKFTDGVDDIDEDFALKVERNEKCFWEGVWGASGWGEGWSGGTFLQILPLNYIQNYLTFNTI